MAATGNATVTENAAVTGNAAVTENAAATTAVQAMQGAAVKTTAISTMDVQERTVTDRSCRLRRQCQDPNRETFLRSREPADADVKNKELGIRKGRMKVRSFFRQMLSGIYKSLPGGI